ncbi:MAG TPA: TolC family protein, partial [bacterium]|nr:TolC family protein [bacterium]
ALGQLVTIALAHSLEVQAGELAPLRQQALQDEQRALFYPTLVGAASRQVDKDLFTLFALTQTAATTQYEVGVRELLPDNTRVSVTAASSRSRVTYLDNPGNTWPLFDPLRRSTLTVAVAKPLLRGAWRENACGQLDLAHISEQAAVARLQRLRGEVIAGIEKQYWLLARLEIEEDLCRRSLARARLILDERRGAAARGQAPEVDVLAAAENIAARRADLLRLVRLRRDAADALALLVYGELTPRQLRSGELVLQTAGLAVTVPGLPADSIAVRRALAVRDDVVEAQHNYAQAQLAAKLAGNATLPQLDVFGDYAVGRYTQDGGLSYNATTSAITMRGSNPSTMQENPWSVGVQLSIPIGASPDDARAQLARLALAEQRLGLAALEGRIYREVRQALRACAGDREQVALREQALTAAAAQLRAAWGAYRLGKLSTFQFLQYSAHFDEQYAAALAAQYDLACAVTDYYQASGLLLNLYLDPAAAR